VAWVTVVAADVAAGNIPAETVPGEVQEQEFVIPKDFEKQGAEDILNVILFCLRNLEGPIQSAPA
jgi:hypothetical protein